MAICGDLGTFATFSASRPSCLSPNSSFKVKFGDSNTRGFHHLETSTLRLSQVGSRCHNSEKKVHSCLALAGNNPSPANMSKEVEGLLFNAINMSFFDRLGLAWRILFPTPFQKRSSNASIAKQRLKMILYSDRCAVNDEAKQKIVSNIVDVLSDFVEIDSQDKVQLSVSTDTDLGTVYSVIVPVRRVKAEYQEYDEEYRGITNIEYRDSGGEPGIVDVRFDFSVPDKQ